MKTTVYQVTPRFNQMGHRLPGDLHETPDQISAGLVARLQRYAKQRLIEAGFNQAADWTPEAYTLDAEDKPADRAYTVRFQSNQGGYIEVIGILTRSGWPSLDHGLAVGQD